MCVEVHLSVISPTFVIYDWLFPCMIVVVVFWGNVPILGRCGRLVIINTHVKICFSGFYLILPPWFYKTAFCAIFKPCAVLRDLVFKRVSIENLELKDCRRGNELYCFHNKEKLKSAGFSLVQLRYFLQVIFVILYLRFF